MSAFLSSVSTSAVLLPMLDNSFLAYHNCQFGPHCMIVTFVVVDMVFLGAVPLNTMLDKQKK